MWENTNKLLEKEGYYGCKTGITKPAGKLYIFINIIFFIYFFCIYTL